MQKPKKPLPGQLERMADVLILHYAKMEPIFAMRARLSGLTKNLGLQEDLLNAYIMEKAISIRIPEYMVMGSEYFLAINALIEAGLVSKETIEEHMIREISLVANKSGKDPAASVKEIVADFWDLFDKVVLMDKNLPPTKAGETAASAAMEVLKKMQGKS